MRKTIIILVLIFIGPIILYTTSLWENNRSVQAPDKVELAASLDKAINWLEANMKENEEHKSPPLWWMIKQAAEVSGNRRLVSFYKKHEGKLLNTPSWYIWAKMFDSNASVKLPELNALNNLPYYDYLYLYGLTCDVEWGNEPEVQRQLNLELCTMHFLQPRCVTNQLLGVRFMQRNNCGDPDQLEALIQGLQNLIVKDLTWDPRIIAVYIERVLMLVESGAIDRVKPVWIRRILDAQNIDGGWDGLDPVLRLPNGKVLGINNTMLVYRETRSNFNATVKGIWLLILLLDQ